jgi:NADH dehydrogenase FAD-containing subunit
MSDRILAREDADAAATVAAALAADGVALLTGHKAIRVEQESGVRSIIVVSGGQEKRIEYDALLCAVGRVPRVTGYGLEELGIPIGTTERSKPTPICKRRTPISMRVATLPVHINLPILRWHTRLGTRQPTRCWKDSGISSPTIR